MPNVQNARGGQGASQNSMSGYYNNDPSVTGNYAIISLAEIINNFVATYVGAGKILEGTLKGDVHYHAHRALQELHYDTLKSCKSIEITLPPSLIMVVPNDYVNYTKLTYADDNGIEHILYPTSKTSNPTKIQQDPDGNYLFNDDQNLYQGILNVTVDEILSTSIVGTQYEYHVQNPYGYNDSVSPTVYNNSYAREHGVEVGMEIASDHFPPGTKIESVSDVPGSPVGTFYFTLDKPSINTNDVFDVELKVISNSVAWERYKSSSNNSVSVDSSTTTNLAVDADNYFLNDGERYGLSPQNAQANGSFYIDCQRGKVHFSSNLSGKKIILHYLSDGHGSDEEMFVHKFAEEAMYRWIAYGCLIAKAGIPENVIQRFKREKFAETRKAKIRLSNIKIEEIAQVLRGKSKFIDH